MSQKPEPTPETSGGSNGGGDSWIPLNNFFSFVHEIVGKKKQNIYFYARSW